MLDDLLQRFRDGDRRALARLLSLVARGEAIDQIFANLEPAPRPSRVVAITGSGGVGKSTLAGRLVEQIRAQGKSVAVLACDPQSPLTGGALLGDRFRMPNRPNDADVFIRSVAAASGHGALADNAESMIRLFEVFGFDVVLCETVGAGQGDTAVHDLADAVVLLLQPDTGDEIQWEKAGLLEVADVLVIHKVDLPGAAQLEAQVRGMLELSNHKPAAVLQVSSTTGTGIDQLWGILSTCPLRRSLAMIRGRDLLRLGQAELATRFSQAMASQHPGVVQLLATWRDGGIDAATAADSLLQLLEPEHRPC